MEYGRKASNVGTCESVGFLILPLRAGSIGFLALHPVTTIHLQQGRNHQLYTVYIKHMHNVADLKSAELLHPDRVLKSYCNFLEVILNQCSRSESSGFFVNCPLDPDIIFSKIQRNMRKISLF